MTITLTYVETEIRETRTMIKAARDLLPDNGGDELTDSVLLIYAAEKKLDLLADAIPLIGTELKQGGKS